MGELIILLVAGGFAVAFCWFAAGNLRRAWVVWATPTTPCGDVRPGMGRVEVHGEVSALSGSLSSPMHGVPCVYFKFRIREKVKRGKSSKWVTRVEDFDCATFLVEDDTGAVEVEVIGAETHFAVDGHASSGFLNDPTPELEELLGRYGMSATGMVFNKTLKYEETVIEVGDPIYVLGESIDGGSGGFPLITRDISSGMLLVSDSSEGGLMASLLGWGVFQLVAGVVILGLGAFLLGIM